MPYPQPARPAEADLFLPKEDVNTAPPSTALVYGGEVITERGEMLSLTSMWTAARRKHVEDGGSAADFDNRRPAQWLRSSEAKRFIAALAKALNVGNSHISETTRGVGGETFAHWQVGLAYAQYLDPKFHMWTNTVVRAHMEGRNGPTPAVVPLVPSSIREIVADFRALFGLAKLVGLDKNQCVIRANRATLEDHGVDLMGKLGNPLLEAPDQEVLLTVGDVGQRLGGFKAKATNLLLTKHGFQVRLTDSKGVIHYEPTERGRPHSRMMDVDTKHRGASKQYLAWLSSVVQPLEVAIQQAEDR